MTNDYSAFRESVDREFGTYMPSSYGSSLGRSINPNPMERLLKKEKKKGKQNKLNFFPPLLVLAD